MKTAIFFSALLFGALCTQAQQNTSGKIVFEETIKMEIKLQGEDAERFRDMIPKERKFRKTLLYTPGASLYSAEKAPVEEMSSEHEGAVVRMRVSNSDEKVFCDLQKGERIEQKDFMSRKFLIVSQPEAKDWKMTGNQKTILGYPCQEAIKQDSLSKTVVWFTPAIPVSTGPAVFSGLPGMVLAAEINDGKMVIQAVSVEPGEVAAELLVKPKEGKKVTQEEFKLIMDEKLKEMQMENGGAGGGNVIIRMETR